MNYEANTIQWKRGDLVLHDADAKKPDMLMEVTGYAKDGRCATRYKTPCPMNGGRRTRWLNSITVLHDPKRFGVSSNAEVSGFESAAPTVRTTTATKP
jgi:hypothetical protein